ncbi:MAG: aromatic amino acid transaminase [Phycisphaeraceae bacterium]
MFQSVQPAPPDAILGLTEAFKADANPDKINLAVGVYKDEHGNTPTLAAVTAAEKWLVDNEPTKAYLGIDGSPGYGRSTRELLFGPGSDLIDNGRAVTFQCPGGTGALRIAGDYLAGNHAGATLWLSDPTWANHHAIFQAAGLPTQTYAYLDAEANALDFDGMLSALDGVKPGDVVLLHGCCHNPTGVDPTLDQWRQIAERLQSIGAMPLIDFAYQGFAVDVEADAAGLREVLRICDEALVCSSYSKNFGLYRERVGALTAVAANRTQAAAVQSQVKATIRRNYSNPPAHGALVVERILDDAKLTQQWLDELADMRSRINGMRSDLRQALDHRGVVLGDPNASDGGNGFIEQQNGMFTMSGLSKDQVNALKADHAIYIVGSGRINVAGITPSNLDRLCDAIAAVVA